MTFEYPYAGMILPDVRDLHPEPYLESAAKVLARLDPRPDAKSPTRRQPGRVMGHHLGISVLSEELSDYGPRVVLEVVTADGTPPDETDAARLLSDTVRAALDHSSADILEWFAPDTLIDRDDFIRLRNFVSPRRIGRVDTEIEDALFESAAAAQGICGTLYPKRSKPAEIPNLPAVVAQSAMQRRPSRFGLRRASQMMAVTSLIAVLSTTGQMDYFLRQLLQ
ncbi:MULTISPECIES: hypothetical protein [Mameliella]|uniref:Uncharacterized protein n=1 Tax=Mameliella alba TaxID=561184 RepID=A0A0B3S0B7_9RHOB|nr:MULTISPECIES: hypothetical protein [Mameliella]MBV6636611.1 hypothetical protein [Mameliella sp.]ODM48204.1 hypothetical protein A9320_20140 [Ruegeria sp. PBVC088]KHQ49961.1 hypothetical protein OA50_05482 [Mameliella alba]MDD9728862.1 hypothetical protein [Mameliella sp. AT18]OWV43130.1 hypothetical protein CDZ96_22685 [Mameliella alba]